MQARHFVILPFLLLVHGLTALNGFAKEPPAPQVVDLAAADGIKLKASYFSAGKLAPGVLLLHQCDHERKIWDGLARQLAAAGINVLTFDLRGFGESGGEPHDKVPPARQGEQMQKWPADIDVAFQYLKSQPGVTPDLMGIGGASCGVDNAIKTAMRHPEVKSLVLLAGPTDLKGRQFLRQSKLPAFFAVADDDQYPLVVQMTELLYVISDAPGKKFAQYKTGHHGAEIFSVHPDLPAAIVDWYLTTLIKTPGRAPAVADAPVIAPEIHALDLLEQPGGPGELAQQLSAARKKDPKAPFIGERIMEWLAYGHIEAGDDKQAVEMLRVNADAYPDSPNAYNLLGKAYLAGGQKDLARQNTQKALQLLPLDTVDPQNFRDAIKAAAEQRLKQLDGAQ